MLFMGTEKYKGENEYTEFIKNNGGMNNAYTSLTNKYELKFRNWFLTLHIF